MRAALVPCLVALGVITCWCVGVVGQAGYNENSNPKAKPRGCVNKQDSFLLLVSTLDGKLSALNMEEEGKLEWSLDIGSEPLLSSSISKLEIKRNGVPLRIVPSLDGLLYEFDGKTVQALPFTADTLLSSSFKFSDDCVVVGRKEISTYGIDVISGETKYFCGKDGCVRFDSTFDSSNRNGIVVSRKTKTVRAVEMATGVEKWNFSVGEHEVSLVKNQMPVHIDQNDMSEETQTFNGDQDSFVTSCPEDDSFDFSWIFGEKRLDTDIKVIVPNGQILAFSKQNPSHVLWGHKFDVPIANVWNLQGETLTQLSVFDDTIVPALESNTPYGMFENGDYLPETPSLYVGVHKNQMYIQQSHSQTIELKDKIHQSAHQKNALVDMPKVLWKPYLATAMTRTPALIGKRSPLRISWEDKKPPPAKKDTRKVNASGELTVPITEHYPFDGGYYLFMDTTPLPINNSLPDDSLFSDDITVTLWNWWREVVLITIVTGVLVHVLTIHIMKKFTQRTNTISAEALTHATSFPTMSSHASESSSSLNSECQQLEFVSRFHNEFKHTSCLGKGGFGVVFEASNKVDDCEYAIKRIALNNSNRAREKVMREVKALAKLDHGHIVRYYQAWFENPPPGWQEDIDRQNSDMFPSCTPTPIYSHDVVQSYTSAASPKVPMSPSALKTDSLEPFDPFAQNYLDYHKQNPLKPYGQLKENQNEDEDDQWIVFEDDKKGSSEGFVPSLRSGSGTVNSWTVGDSESFSTDTMNSCSKSGLPFSLYKKTFDFSERSKDSLDIVFEDSGCAEKNSEDIFFEKMEEASGTNCGDEDYSWIEFEGLRRRGYDTVSQSEKVSKLQKDAHDQDSFFKSQQNEISSSPVRPESLTLSRNTPERRATPVAKLYLYIQMQLCRKESLKDWLNENTLNRDRSQLLDIFDQIVSAVGYIHDSGLMHRDLKPSNIFFSLDGQVKVGDFGLVTASEEKCIEEDFEYDDRRCGWHRHTDQVGTKMYMSPEQASGRTYSNKVDIYSLGLIFFELFYPFDTQMERIKTLMDVRSAVYPLRFQKELKDECTFVKKLLQTKPEERPSAKAIQRDHILQDFEEIRQSISRSRSRHRTVSNGSSNSNSTVGSASPH